MVFGALPRRPATKAAADRSHALTVVLGLFAAAACVVMYHRVSWFHLAVDDSDAAELASLSTPAGEKVAAAALAQGVAAAGAWANGAAWAIQLAAAGAPPPPPPAVSGSGPDAPVPEVPEVPDAPPPAPPPPPAPQDPQPLAAVATAANTTANTTAPPAVYAAGSGPAAPGSFEDPENDETGEDGAVAQAVRAAAAAPVCDREGCWSASADRPAPMPAEQIPLSAVTTGGDPRQRRSLTRSSHLAFDGAVHAPVNAKAIWNPFSDETPRDRFLATLYRLGGYANWGQCDDRVGKAVDDGVNVILWFAIGFSYLNAKTPAHRHSICWHPLSFPIETPGKHVEGVRAPS